MNNFSEIWSKRFQHYMNEVQKYMRFVFTGHLALVLVFVIGGLGYQYSEWLKVVEPSFPAEWLISIIIGILIAFSRPVTLIKEPDQVYLLPLEIKMKQYFQKALNWTFWSQILLAVICYIVSIPLLKAVTNLTIIEIWIVLLIIVLLKYFNVIVEFHYRYKNPGQTVYVDRIARIIVSILAILFSLTKGVIWCLPFFVIFIAYYVALKKKVNEEPIPYEHFVKLEFNRMMGFYRFANYFTDVPHLKGSIRRRGWLNFIYQLVGYSKKNTQSYLVFRTFIRTDDHFYLWVRLTIISSVIALFVNIPIVTWIVSGALAFATTIQLKYALLSKTEFRMDMLYPIVESGRKLAVQKVLRLFMIFQGIIVMLCSIGQPFFYLQLIIIIVMSELTFQLSKEPKSLFE